MELSGFRTMLCNRTTLFSIYFAIGLFPISVIAQEESEDAEDQEEVIEELVVTGSHIKGADVSGILPVSVFDSQDIEALGVDSGDALLDMIPEQGQNFFNEEENISGGVNAARGDIGAFNLRNFGTGNTLVLINGRRMVNAASYQTEVVGGSFVPVNTANSNTLPVYGIERTELLKDGASAIYGADAVAGVVNMVLKADLEGYKVKVRRYFYELVDRNNWVVNLEYGRNFNGGRTNIGIMGDFSTRDAIKSSEDERWANSDLRYLIPEDSPWFDDEDNRFRNNSANSIFGQFDIVETNLSRRDIYDTVVDRSGEFETYPIGDARCQWTINERVCGGRDGQGTYRYNINEVRDLSSALDRANVFVHVNHDFDNGMESFSELMYYSSSSLLSRHPSAPFPTVKLRVGAENYYNPFGPCGSPNRLPESVIGDVPCAGYELEIDFYRFTEVPRIIENDGTVFRLLQGLRGATENGWDWEGAVVWSRASRLDLTRNRVSNTLISDALNDSTATAYNPFSGGVDSNIEQALIDVYRKNAMVLFLVDYKMSKSDLFELSAGPVAGLIGIEFRRESFLDNRDPGLDGTILYTDHDGDTFPFISDVVNSSPTPDNEGSRRVSSLFTEFSIPVHESIDAQAALRYENFSDVDGTVVGKLAAGWRIHDSLLVRASWSESFRVPNLVTINETIVARQNTRTDQACRYASLFGGDPGQDTVDCRNSIQRSADGSKNLEPESSENVSIGLVFEPVLDDASWGIEDVIFTADYWSIVKEDTIGLFGEENHTVYDLLLRLMHGNDNCDAFSGNPNILRADQDDDDVIAVYDAAGICAAGDIARVEDNYANLDTRSLKGFDVGLKWKLETDFGRFGFRYLVSILTEFEQEGIGRAAELFAARDSGLLPVSIPIAGFGDLIQKDGNQDFKSTFLATWRFKDFGASLSQTTLGEFYQESLTIDQDTVTPDDDIRYWIDALTTWNVAFDYRFKTRLGKSTVRFGVRNALNERAPLADRYFGFFSDAHRDYGRNYYVDFILSD